LIIYLSVIVLVVEGFNFVDETEPIIKGLPSGQVILDFGKSGGDNGGEGREAVNDLIQRVTGCDLKALDCLYEALIIFCIPVEAHEFVQEACDPSGKSPLT
jgi:hypothetical protein